MTETRPDERCLNCGARTEGAFCPDCGQRNRPTLLPIRTFVVDALRTVFELDGRWLHSFTGLFVRPGRMTLEYVRGRRARYLPPLRLYIVISLLYFLVVTLTRSEQVFFTEIQGLDGAEDNLARVMQYALMLFVLVMAGLIHLLHRRHHHYFVGSLITSLHIHSVWLSILIAADLLEAATGGIENAIVSTASTAVLVALRLGLLVYLVLYLRRVFAQSWPATLIKAIVTFAGYMLSLAGFVFVYILLVRSLM